MPNKYLRFVEIATDNKYSRFEIRNLQTDHRLGIIQYYPQWRQFVYVQSHDPAIFNSDCLKEIASELIRLNLTIKVELQNKKVKDT